MNGLVGDPTADTGFYDSITAAVRDATAGEMILVTGLEAGGVPVGYTNQPVPGNPNSTGETFPIQVPPGITITTDTDGPPVYIWHDAALAPPTLFELPGANGSTAETRLEELVLVGGVQAVKIDWSGGDRASVVLAGLSFVRNRVGVLVQLADGSEVGYDGTRLEVNGCWVAYKDLRPRSGPPRYTRRRSTACVSRHSRRP